MLSVPMELVVAGHVHRYLSELLKQQPKLGKKNWEIEASCLDGGGAPLVMQYESIVGARRERLRRVELRFTHKRSVSITWLDGTSTVVQKIDHPVEDCHWAVSPSGLETKRQNLGLALALFIWNYFIDSPVPPPADAHGFINSRLA